MEGRERKSGTSSSETIAKSTPVWAV